MSKLIASIVFLFCILDAKSLDLSSDCSMLVQKLQAENAQLKLEIQNLRKLLASQPRQNLSLGNVSTVSPIPPSPQISSIREPQSRGYWITTSSKKRHNSSCRYFQNSNGKHCGPEDGIPCKLCGG